MTLLLTIDWDEVWREVGVRGGRVLGVALAVAIILIVLDRVISPAVRRVVRRTSAGLPAEEEQRLQTVMTVIHRTMAVLVIGVGFVTAVTELGVNVGPVLAGAGIVGLAVGFGAQSLVRDAINGVFILLENQYAIGDVVNVAGREGIVEDLNLRRTVVRDLDGAVHYVPNSQVAVATNLTRTWTRLSATTGADVARVARAIDEAGASLASDPYFGQLVLQPPACLKVSRVQDVGIAVTLPADAPPARVWEVVSELRRRVEERFRDEGIALPFPRVVITRTAASPSAGGIAQ